MREEDIRNKLKEIITRRSLRFGEFILASGKKSNYYINGKNTTLEPEGLNLICKIFLNWIKKEFADIKGVGGPTLGADPIVGGIVALSIEQKNPLKGFIIRKEPKGHGTNQWIEGRDNFSSGEKVILIEDVITTGGTSFKSIEKIKSAGLILKGVFCIVDRMQGAEEKFNSAGIPFRAIFTIDEFLKKSKIDP